MRASPFTGSVRVFVTNEKSDDATVIDARSLTVVRSVPASRG